MSMSLVLTATHQSWFYLKLIVCNSSDLKALGTDALHCLEYHEVWHLV